MSSPPSDPAVQKALARIADELAAIHQGLAGLAAENASLRARLDHSETARADLFAQAERILELLADSRREVRHLQAQAGQPGG